MCHLLDVNETRDWCVQAVGEMLTARTRLEEASKSNAEVATSDEQIDPVQVEMLLGKAYSTWDGHSGDAIAVYDNIIASYPNDFRGYLAKVTIYQSFSTSSYILSEFP